MVYQDFDNYGTALKGQKDGGLLPDHKFANSSNFQKKCQWLSSSAGTNASLTGLVHRPYGLCYQQHAECTYKNIYCCQAIAIYNCLYK